MKRLAATASVLVLVCTASPVFAQETRATVTGRVTDGSGAALPGVSVTLRSTTDTAVTATVVTDGVGQYLTPRVPPGSYVITFELSGFEPQTRAATALRAGDVAIFDQQLGLASLTESVEVVGAAPAPPPPVPHVKLEAPKKPQPLVVVPKEVLASVCGPTRPSDASMTIGKLLAHRDEPARRLYGSGDVLLLDVGSDIGLIPGQNLVVRRRFRIGDKAQPLARAAFGEQTAGLIQLVETGPISSVAVVVYACGELFAGDAVEPFDALPQLSTKAMGTPQYDEPAHVVLGEHGQTLGAERQLMVIDRGATQGAERGQRLTIFRRALGDRGPVRPIADAVIVAVRADSATIRIERTSDAVTVGDYVALHR